MDSKESLKSGFDGSITSYMGTIVKPCDLKELKSSRQPSRIEAVSFAISFSINSMVGLTSLPKKNQ